MLKLFSTGKNLLSVLLEQAVISSEVTLRDSKVSGTDSLEQVFSTFLLLPALLKEKAHTRNSKI